MAMYIATSLHFSIRIKVFEEPGICTVRKSGRNRLYVDITKWKLEVIGSYEM